MVAAQWVAYPLGPDVKLYPPHAQGYYAGSGGAGGHFQFGDVFDLTINGMSRPATKLLNCTLPIEQIETQDWAIEVKAQTLTDLKKLIKSGGRRVW